MIESPWRKDFPIFQQLDKENYRYLDSAATAQKPQIVLDIMDKFYRYDNAAVHRGIHRLSARATDQMELIRERVAQFIHAPSENNIVFTKGTTEAINLIANSYLPTFAQEGDEIIISELEHHANIVPWQMLAQKLGLKIKVWRLSDNNRGLCLDEFRELLTEKTKLVAISQLSNVLGTVQPIKEAICMAHQVGAAVMVDGAQGIMHQQTNVQELGCDFYAFSAHKLYGPTGIGALYIAPKWLQQLPPWEGGGAMIDKVDLFSETSYQAAPWRFEAGSPNVAAIMGFGAAIEYVSQIGLSQIQDYEKQLMSYMSQQFSDIDNVELYGDGKNRHGVLSFNLTPHHAFDVGSFLDQYGIAIRTGHHCAMPLLKRLDQAAVCRASIALYNNAEDIDRLVASIKRTQMLLG